MQTWIETFDHVLRGAGIGVLCLQLLRFITVRSIAVAQVLASALCLSLICYILVSSPMLRDEIGPAAKAIRYLPVFVPFLFWWTFLAIFDDGFRWRGWHVIPLLLVVLPVFAIDRVAGAGLFRGAVVAALYVHLVLIAVRTAAADLDEPRRHFRRWFLIISALLGLVITAVEVTVEDGPLPAFVFPLHAAAILLLSTVFALWSMRLRDELWAGGQRARTREENGLSAAENALLLRLNSGMDAEIWRREGLTIGRLAEELGAPEHRLRRVINQGLGYRNFTAFMNERRISAACAILSDAQSAETPILTIAFDCGYSSLGPFNRAFRSIVGESPTEFRRRKLNEAGQN